MIQSLERASEILHLFEEKKFWGITQIAERVQLSKSTVFGLVSTMEKLGFLEKHPDSGKYSLGLELYRLGNMVDGDLRQMILPELSALVDQLGETINYVRPEGTDVIYLIKKESSHSMRICTKNGQRYPMYATGVGQAILAFLPEQEQRTIVSATTFSPYTSNTIVQPEQLLLKLQQIRSQGYAVDDEGLENGLICVAVPVFGPNSMPIAALSCSGPKIRMTEEKIQQCVSSLKVCAQQLRDLIVQ